MNVKKQASYNKKILLFLCVILCLSTLCACVRHSANDSESGDVIQSEQKVNFPDGDYCVYESYYAQEGMAAVLIAKVSGGKIVEINFDYIYYGGARYSQSAGEENRESVEQSLSEIRSLNTYILAKQSVFEEGSTADRLKNDYRILCNALFALFGENQAHTAAVDFERSFKIVTAPDENGTHFCLQAKYRGAQLTDITFSYLDSAERNVPASNRFISSFNENAALLGTMNFAQTLGWLSALPKDDSGLCKQSPEGGENLAEIYNSLAEHVENMHAPFDGSDLV